MKIKLLDGAMGTNLIAAGMPKGVSTEKWILENPDIVKALQSKYVEAGSDILYAPTFGGNSAALGRHGDFGVEINASLYDITKSVCEGKNVLVCGDMSPTGLMLKPYGNCGFDSVTAVYEEQARILAESGAEAFVIETSISLKEVTAAYYGVRRVSYKPVFVTFTVESSCRTLSGESIEACLVALQSKGVAAVGINCSDGGVAVLESVKRMAKYAKVPIIAKPNAGLPTVEGGRVTYTQTPEAFAEFCSELAEAGASYIGGCCGTTPAHIAALGKNRPSVSLPVPVDGEFATDGRELFDVSALVLPEKVECDDCLLFNLPEPDEASCFRIYVPDINVAEIIDETPLYGLPLVIDGADYDAVSAALRLYSGRAVLDPESKLTEEEIKKLTEVFGVITVK